MYLFWFYIFRGVVLALVPLNGFFDRYPQKYFQYQIKCKVCFSKHHCGILISCVERKDKNYKTILNKYRRGECFSQHFIFGFSTNKSREETEQKRNEIQKRERERKNTVKMLIMFQIICTLMKLKEENNEYFDSFGDNVLEVSRKIFNDNCVDNGT